MSKKRISYSQLQSLDCWRKHHYRYVDRLRPVHTFAALNYGTAWDAAQNVWHAPGGTLEEARDAGHLALTREAKRVDGLLVDRGIPTPIGFTEEVEAMRALLDGMLDHYDETWGGESEEWETLGVQIEVVVPLPSKDGTGISNLYEFGGYIDRLVRRRSTGEVYIVDAKSAAGLSADYRAGFDTDWQLPLYVWALRKQGQRIDGAMIDASAKIVPTIPTLRKTPFPVFVPGEFDADGNPVQAVEPVPCTKCEASGDTCADLGCDGLTRFASGARKGEVKTTKVTRPGLTSMLTSAGTLNYTTTARLMRGAIEEHGLDEADYERELAILDAQASGEADSPFHWREELLFNEQQLEEAVTAVRGVAPYAASLPNVKMPSAMKCRSCSFRSICAARPDDRAALIAQNFTTPTEREAAAEPEHVEPAPVF